MATPDIFLSYNREDAARAKHFADGFAAEGFDVWWDVDLRSGEAYDQVTEKALRDAKAVVVLWSPRSVDSRWCRAEATLADRNKTLMPAMIEPCERPIMFELVQTVELSHWQGDRSDAAWKDFASHVRDFIGKEASTPVTAKSDETLPRLDQLSVAVLPFANMSRDEDQEYFADGITEDIITDLSQVSALRVISRNSSFTFKGKHVDVPDVARQLNVTHVLEGSVRKAGNRVRVTAQLINGTDNDHVWAQRFDRDLDDIFALQDELSKAIVDALKLKLLPQEAKAISSRGTDNVEAYDIYLRAQELSRSYGPEDAKRALKLYHRALELDPDFLLALHGLGAALTRAILNTAGDPEQLYAERKAVFEKQVSLAPDAWQTQSALAMQMFTSFKQREGEEACLKAIKNAPPTETRPLFLYASMLASWGRGREALSQIQRVVRMEPLSLESSLFLQMGLRVCGDFEAASREYERSRDLAGDRGIIEYFNYLDAFRLGDRDQVKRQLDRYLRHDSLKMPVLRKMPDVLDQPEAASAMLRAEIDKPANQQSTLQQVLSMHSAVLGDIDTAMVAMRRSLINIRATSYLLLWHPGFFEVRRDPRFKELLREIGLVDFWRETGNWGDFARPVGDDDFEIIA